MRIGRGRDATRLTQLSQLSPVKPAEPAELWGWEREASQGEAKRAKGGGEAELRGPFEQAELRGPFEQAIDLSDRSSNDELSRIVNKVKGVFT